MSWKDWVLLAVMGLLVVLAVVTVAASIYFWAVAH